MQESTINQEDYQGSAQEKQQTNCTQKLQRIRCCGRVISEQEVSIENLEDSQGKRMRNGKGKCLENGQGKRMRNGKGKSLENGQGKRMANGQGKCLENGQGKRMGNGQGKRMGNGQGKRMANNQGQGIA